MRHLPVISIYAWAVDRYIYRRYSFIENRFKRYGRKSGQIFLDQSIGIDESNTYILGVTGFRGASKL